MNRETANHLNRLRENAQPVVLQQDDVFITGPITHELWLILGRLEEESTNAFVRCEIIAAATEKREAKLGSIPYWAVPDNAGTSHNKNDGKIPWESTRKRWIMALPFIRIAINQHNADSKAAYESFRQLCIQGIAQVPVIKDPKDEL